MGFRDRDYYRERPRGFGLGSAVTTLVIVNVVIWLVQVATLRSDARSFIDTYLACRPSLLFEHGFVWQVLTANFLHAPDNPWHILGNMLFLFVFGRELEAIYGKRDFLVFYIAAGCLAIFAEAAIDWFLGGANPAILGASGSVMGVVVLFTLFYPRREIYLMLMIPIQAWLLCVIFVLLDLFGALGGTSGVANWAHLAGAGCAVAYRFLDLRTEGLAARWGRLRRSVSWRLKIARDPRLVGGRREAPPRRKDVEQPAAPRVARDPVSTRIDEILEKISRSGRESLTPEELEFLKANSSRYRSEE